MEFYGSIGLVSGSVTASVLSGSFKGDGSGLYNVQASGVTGLNLSQIANGSNTASVSTNGFNVNTDTSITGSVNISGSISLNGEAIGTGKLNETTFNTYATSSNNRLDSIEVKTGSYATTGSNTFNGTQNISGSIIPTIDNAFDLGSATYQWRDVYISSGSLYIDGTKVLGSTAQELTITTDNGQSIKILENTTDSIILQVADGDIELKSSADGDILLDPTNGKIMLKGPVEVLNGQKIQSSVGGTPVVFANDIVVSGSIDLTGTIEGLNLTDLSSSLSSRLGAVESGGTSLNSFTASASSRLGSLETESGSVRTTVNSYTSSANSRLSSIETTTGSIITTNTTQTNRLDSVELKTGSYATTGSNSFNGNQTITGSLTVTQNLNVLGSASFLIVTSSQIAVSSSTISVNIFEPAERFGGLKVYDSGSESHLATASLLWDSLNNHWIYQNASGSNYSGGMLLAGPRNTGSLGQEVGLTSGKIAKSVGGDHLDNSIITETGGGIGINGNLVITGSIVSSVSSLVSGSSQISFNGITDKPTLISGSSQVSFNTISDKPSLVSGSSQITFSGISGLPTLVSGSSQISFNSISDKPSLVSGSSQIDLTQTTNYSSGILTRLNAVGVFSGSAQVTGIGNSQLTNSSFYVGTTSISLGRASASQTLTGVSIDGNAATVTGGVYTSGDQTISGTKTFSGTVSFGSATRQMVNLWGTQYGIGIQSSTLYYRSDSRFSWHRGGSHSDTENTAGSGGTVAMTLDGSSNLSVTGTISASNFSGTHSGTSSGTNTGDQTNITGTAGSETLGTVTNRGNTTSQNIVFSNGRKGLVGVYDAAQTQAIFAMGSSYVLTDGGSSGTIGNHYGLAWSYNPGYGGAGNNPQSKAGLEHQLLVMNAGITYTAIGVGIWTSGGVTCGTVLPLSNNSYNLGSTGTRWANIYTNDLHLSNEGKEGGNEIDGTTGDWTIQEGEENLYIINHKNGKKFKIDLTEIV